MKTETLKSRLFANLLFSIGVVVTGHALAQEAFADPKEGCIASGSNPGECRCDDAQNPNCVFDKDCLTIYPETCKMT
jgi:hypothetical protein